MPLDPLSHQLVPCAVNSLASARGRLIQIDSDVSVTQLVFTAAHDTAIRDQLAIARFEPAVHSSDCAVPQSVELRLTSTASK
ncbi:hypothetical protein D3C71_1191480 [compost metagenome]